MAMATRRPSSGIPSPGTPLSITSQDGQITTLTLDANGYIATVANPNCETFQMGYDAKGLMTAFTRPKALTDPDPLANYTTTVTYDALGLMDRDTGADNGFLQTVRTEDADGYTVSATTAEGRLSTFRIEEDAIQNIQGQLWGHLEKIELTLSINVKSL